MVFQKPNPFPAMSIDDNVPAGLALTGDRGSPDEQDELVEDCLTQGRAVERGQGPAATARAGRSRAASSSGCASPGRSPSGPEVLLMDEPCSALDPTSTRRIEETIEELRDEVTIVIVTHNMQQAPRVSATGGVLPGRAGDAWEASSSRARPVDLFDNPADPRTTDYVHGRFG